MENRPQFTLLKRDNTIDGKPLHKNDLTVFDLKKVKKANQWKLWKVKDLIKGTKKWKALEGIEDSNTETVIKNELKGDKLSPAMDLKDVFLMMTFRKV